MSIDSDTAASPIPFTPRSPDGGTDPTNPLRVVLFGAGAMARHHAAAIQRLAPSARIVGVADPSPEALAAMGRVAPGAVLETDAARLLDAVGADVAHVCTPPAHHVAGARVALEAGLHVYVEKPFAPTASEAGDILKLARRRDRKVCAGHQLLAEQPTVEALRLLPALLELVHVESYFAFRPVRRTPDGSSPLPQHLQLLDILPHPVYLLVHFLEAAQPNADIELASLEVAPSGTLHALVRAGSVTGSLVVTLAGRPVENYLRVVGTNGSLTAEFVRGTVQRSIGPGVSGIDKALGPYRQARQLTGGTTAALWRRVSRRNRSYPGLAEMVDAFYETIRQGRPSPVSASNILATTRMCEAVAASLERPRTRTAPPGSGDRGGRVVVTGGTGFLGSAVVRALRATGRPVTVLARRAPAPWDAEPDVAYVTADLSVAPDLDLPMGAETVIHCAAATSGGWEEHQAHSLDATEYVLRAAHRAGVKQFIHVSSLSVLESQSTKPLSDNSPLQADSRGSGPYAWGKLESERIAQDLAAELGVGLRIVRPGAIIEERAFEPPGRLGRRIGNVFVAVGSPRDVLGVVDLDFVARTLAWIAEHFQEAPEVLNLVAPEQPTKRMLIRRLRSTNPDLRVIWLPRLLLHPLSWTALAAQKLLRPGRPAINVASVFAPQTYDTSTVSRLARRMRGEAQ
jgi:predicted dehydrogenase/nucleoside-diphosphate-sugar epimerase